MKKKILIYGLFLLCIISFCACNNKPSKNDVKVTNKQIAQDLEKALEGRWELSNKIDDDNQTQSDYAVTMQKYITTELKILKKYSNKNISFENKDVQNLIVKYIQTLNKQYALFDNYLNAPTKLNYNYYVYNSQRVSILNDLDKQIHLSFKKKDSQKTYSELIKENGYCPKGASLIDDTYKIEQIKIEPSNFGYRTYKIKIKNLTDLNYDMVNINVRLYDKDGTVVTDQMLNYYNLKGYQSMWEQSSFSTKDNITKLEVISYGCCNKVSSGQYEYYESDTPFTKMVTKEF